jgi:hypothetical protein
MMPLVSFGWNAVAFVLCLAGFFFLVFANEREGRRLLHRPASKRECWICAVVFCFFLRSGCASKNGGGIPVPCCGLDG